ncbi:choline transport protein [Penicillium angulare]|uniref:choline transport protein n=1 Tax=Penicillium angulare TaxID=116970 RepID=UPI002540DB7C|nr:choline transport protein [Penicillium angulare]KAJ5266655.1 choline transport protein [Penicillium angulare]
MANLIGGKCLQSLETPTFVIHILGFFRILVPLAYMSSHKSTSEVFGPIQNSGDFASDGLAWFVGMASSINLFAGGDAAIHFDFDGPIAEEVENTAVALPQALILSLIVDGCLGLGMLLVTLYSRGTEMNGLWVSTKYFHRVTGSFPGAVAITYICTILVARSTFAVLAAASRQFWSLARDSGMPGWRSWERISSRKLPTRAILLASLVARLISLIDLGSTAAHLALTSTAVTSWNMSYLIV